MATMSADERQRKALAQVLAAVELFRAHLRAKLAHATPSAREPLNPDGNPAQADDTFWSYFSEVDCFRQVGDPTHKAATAIGRAFGGPVKGRAAATAFMVDNGVPLYWATWALAN